MGRPELHRSTSIMNEHISTPAVASVPRIQGWCPGALRPMHSGDGLVMRLRPRLARFTRDQIVGICDVAQRHAAGLIDITSRANLQVRGVAEADWPLMRDAFARLDLLDATAEREARRNLLVAPDWVPGDDTESIATELIARLDELPDLPAKVGFAIDAGAAPCLVGDSADFRIERAASGGLILRADGRASGMPVAPGTAVDSLIELAHWFVRSGGLTAGRMARHAEHLPEWARGTGTPAGSAPRLACGRHPLGLVCGLPFGQVEAAALARAVLDSAAVAVRLTPWRRLLLEGAHAGARPDLASGWFEPDALEAAGWRVEACAGAPFCPQASVETRTLARRLMGLAQQGRIVAPDGASLRVPGTVRVLHVSGCAKVCAYPGVADISLIGCDGAFELSGRAGGPPYGLGLSADAVVSMLERR